jgi:hypothetical protein
VIRATAVRGVQLSSRRQVGGAVVSGVTDSVTQDARALQIDGAVGIPYVR